MKPCCEPGSCRRSALEDENRRLRKLLIHIQGWEPTPKAVKDLIRNQLFPTPDNGNEPK